MKRDFSIYCLLLVLLQAMPLAGFAQDSKRDLYHQQLNTAPTADEIVADIDFLYTALEAAHPDLNRYVSKPQLDSMIASIKAKAGKITLREFYRELSQLVSTIGCGHLRVDYPKKMEAHFLKHSYLPPLHINVYDTLALVTRDLWWSKAYAGYRIRSLNGVPIDSIIEQMNTFLSRDGQNVATNKWMMEKGWFSLMFIRYWPDSTHYRYTLQAPTDSGGWGMEYPVVLRALDYKDFKNRLVKRTKVPPQLTLKHDEETNTAILTIKSFDPTTIARGKQKFKKFIKEAFWRIYQTKPDQVIIDLRDNGGGSTFYPYMVIGFLSHEPFQLYKDMEIRYRLSDEKRPKLKIKGQRAFGKLEKKSAPGNNGNLSVRDFKDNMAPPFPYAFGGKVYVMVNGGSYSAASELACYLKEHIGAVVVGTETGGSCDPITAGMHGLATLPNTGIVVHIPLITMYKNVTPPTMAGCGLKPDIKQQLRPTDSIPDPELDRLLEHIDGILIEQ